MNRAPLPEERGADPQRDSVDPVPEELCHVVERVDDHDRPPFDRCAECGRTGPPAAISPFAECPAREFPSAVEVRAEAAEADDSQASLTGALGRADGGAD